MKTYDKIAVDFAKTRNCVWTEFFFFKNYIKKNDRILDIGCGSARLLDFFEKNLDEKYFYTGIDNSKNMIKISKKKYPNKNFLFADFCDLPFKKNSFDKIFAIASFHHLLSVKKQKKAVAQMNYVLKKDGMIFLSVWNLFQKRYAKYFFRDFIFKLTNFSPFSLLIPFGKEKIKRKYFAFTAKKVEKLFMKDFDLLIKMFTYSKTQKRNIVFILKKC